MNSLTKQPLRIVFAGTPEFAADHLSALLLADRSIVAVFTQPDKPGKRGKEAVASPVKLLCLERDLPLYQPSAMGATAIAALQALRPDLLVVVAYGHKLPGKVLNLPPFGCINVHASLLPRWRGAAPIQRAIQAGDRQTGITIMQMDEGWDTGDLLHSARCTITDQDTAASLQEKLSALGQTALNQVVDLIQAGHLSVTPQAEEGSCYASKLSKTEAAIDWSLPAEQIQRNIRSYIPNPVAYSWLESLRIKIWQAEVVSDPNIDAGHNPGDAAGSDTQPGEIVAIDKQGILVSCGSGTIRLLRVQLPIGKGAILTPTDLLNARRDLFRPGRRLRASGIDP